MNEFQALRLLPRNVSLRTTLPQFYRNETVCEVFISGLQSNSFVLERAVHSRLELCVILAATPSLVHHLSHSRICCHQLALMLYHL